MYGIVRNPDPELLGLTLRGRGARGGTSALQMLLERGAEVDWMPPAQDEIVAHMDPRERAEEAFYGNLREYGPVEAALHIAAEEGNEQAARILIERGASIDLKDGMGRTPLERAKENGRNGIIQMFSEVETDAK